MSTYASSVITEDPLYLQPKSYSAGSDRKPFSDIMREGVVGTNDFLVTSSGGLVLGIAAGVAWIRGDNSSDQGSYREYTASSRTVNGTAGHATLPRVDQVIQRVMDTAADSSTFSETRIEYVPGVATAGANETNMNGAADLTALTQASKSLITLAVVVVPNGAAAITGGMIFDRRPRALVGGGDALLGGSSVNFAAAGSKPDATISRLAAAVLQTDAGHVLAKSYTTAGRSAIAAGFRPAGMIIYNSTLEEYEQNFGSDANPAWRTFPGMRVLQKVTAKNIDSITNGTGLVDMLNGEFTIPAHYLEKVGRRLQFEAIGSILNDTGAARTVQMGVMLGALNIQKDDLSFVNSATVPSRTFRLFFEMVVFHPSTWTYYHSGFLQLAPQAAASLVGGAGTEMTSAIGPPSVAANATNIPFGGFGGITFDPTVSNNFLFNIALTFAHANLQASLQYAEVRIV